MNRIRVSSSIVNFKEKLLAKYPDYGPWNLFSPTIFFGCYHSLDYLRITLHRGTKVLVWCGSDILALTPFRARLLRRQRILHYCENDVEWLLLDQFGLKALVQPLFFGDATKYPVTYTQSDRPQVFLSTHPKRGKEYGVSRVLRIARKVPEVTFHIYGCAPRLRLRLRRPKNVKLHPRVSEERFDSEIRGYQAALRLNRFDGFGEVLAKSVLLGQHPISTIPYYGVDAALSDEELTEKLRALSGKKEPNPYREYWFTLLNKRIEI